MKKTILLVIFSTFLLAGFGQTSVKKVAILETVDKKGDVNYGILFQVRSSLTHAISNSSGYEGYDRVDMAAIMGEHNFQRTGMVNDTQIKKLGQMTGAAYVLIAEVANYDAKYVIISVKILDVETGAVIGSTPPITADKDPMKMAGACKKICAALIGDSSGQSYNDLSPSSSKCSNMTIKLPSGDHFVMIYVQGGQFSMGCTNDQQRQCDSDESPAHFVTLSDYYIGETEVTQGLWQAVMSPSISQQSNVDKSNYPMYYVSHSEAEDFCGRLNNLLASQLPQGFKFRLPTEAQWEYAARGGKNDTPSLYAGSDSIDNVAWYYNPKSRNKSTIHPVKTKKPNELGIYDMSGNVWEWCADWYNNNYYDSSPSKNPENFRSWGYSRVHRGGSYNCKAYGCRVTARGADSPETSNLVSGFRFVLVHEDAAEQHLETEQDKLKYKKINEELERKCQNELKIGGWVDLGLPSGTLWKDSNEGDGKTYYTYDEAVSKFGNNLPTKAQFEELKNKCTWKWTGRGYTVKGPNGNSIKIPVTGYRSGHDNKEYNSNKNGYYWSSSKSDDNLDTACQLDFNESDVYVNCGKMRSTGLSVRLVM